MSKQSYGAELEVNRKEPSPFQFNAASLLISHAKENLITGGLSFYIKTTLNDQLDQHHLIKSEDEKQKGWVTRTNEEIYLKRDTYKFHNKSGFVSKPYDMQHNLIPSIYSSPNNITLLAKNQKHRHGFAH